MELTVCICTHDRPRYVRDCLEGLRGQTVSSDRFEIVLVDSGSAPAVSAELVQLAGENQARLLRTDQPGVSFARNIGAWAARSPYIAYIDDDAIPAADWIARILAALAEPGRRPAMIGGRILPKWEAPLPSWWPASLVGVLSIVDLEAQGEYRSSELPRRLEPYGANMVVHVLSLIAAGGFGGMLGRYGSSLLSDEEVQLAWALQDRGQSVRYDSRIVVYHQIQAGRLNPDWLLSRLYWQGASAVVTRRMLHRPQTVWVELPRRMAVVALCAPASLVPRQSTRMLAARWRLAYAAGFIQAAFGWRPARTLVRQGASARA
jgi:glycosyltransferase involved in cell wall biosynthesis